MQVYILQRGVQWKQGVVVCMVLCTSLLYNTTPIHCTPLRLHPPLMNTQLLLVLFNRYCYYYYYHYKLLLLLLLLLFLLLVLLLIVLLLSQDVKRHADALGR